MSIFNVFIRESIWFAVSYFRGVRAHPPSLQTKTHLEQITIQSMNSSVAQVNPHNNALWYLGQSTKIGVSVRNYIKEKIILLSKHAFGNTCRCMHKLCCDLWDFPSQSFDWANRNKAWIIIHENEKVTISRPMIKHC